MASNFNFVDICRLNQLTGIKKIRELEEESARKNCTQVFIETPYRNNAMLEAIVKVCKPATKLCIAVEITAASESIHTKTIGEWKKKLPDIHKKPAIFCLLAG